MATMKIAKRTESPQKNVTLKTKRSGSSQKTKSKNMSGPRPGSTPTTEREFLEAWNAKGGNVTEVAEKLNKTRETVHNWRKKLGLVETKPEPISKEKLENALNAKGRDTVAVAGFFEKSLSFIDKLMRKHGISNKGQRGVSKEDLQVLLHYVGDLGQISEITGRNIHSLHQDIYKRAGLKLKDFKNEGSVPGSPVKSNEAEPSKQNLSLNAVNASHEPWQGNFFPTPLFPTVSLETLRTFFRAPIMIL